MVNQSSKDRTSKTLVPSELRTMSWTKHSAQFCNFTSRSAPDRQQGQRTSSQLPEMPRSKSEESSGTNATAVSPGNRCQHRKPACCCGGLSSQLLRQSSSVWLSSEMGRLCGDPVKNPWHVRQGWTVARGGWQAVSSMWSVLTVHEWTE
ncbi:hypothetical protein ElyMa_003843000 [Elysia marginata]|uniref:Uncharacterized protein n=1 Tax=Elysia marginata TaxID=1093978 RepID=A0AAV4FGG5_9GAST|nr:hypothetical protein ElyMa_003843000 [Elysia marginata]